MICPRCGHNNFEGADRCANCIEPLRDRDVPQPTQGFQSLLMEEPISAVSGHQPIVVAPETSIGEAVRLMKQRRLGCVLVVSGNKLEGIFTERDLLLKLIGTEKSLDALLVRDYMTTGPETVEGSDSLRIALNKMSVGGFRHIPVVAEGQVTGLVTAKDALKYIAREALKK